MGKLLCTAIVMALVSGFAIADEADDLAKEISGLLRSGERSMMNGKKEEAVATLLEAQEKLLKLEAKAPRHRKLRSLQSKCGKLKRDLEKRLGRSLDPDAEEQLPSLCTDRLGRVNACLGEAESILSSEKPEVDQAEGQLRNAERFWRSIERDFADEVAKGWPELEAAQKRLAAVQAKLAEIEAAVAGKEAAATEAATRKEAQCKVWEEKLYPYAVGTQPKTRFHATVERHAPTLARWQANYEAAKALLEEYDKVEFPDGKTAQLDHYEEKLREKIAKFPDSYKESLGAIFKDKCRGLEEKIAWLQTPSQQTWRKDEKEKPRTVSDKEMKHFREMIAEAAQVLGEGDERIADVTKKFEGLVKENDERRRVCAERTFMSPDCFKGDERDAAETAIRKIVKREFPDAKVLKIALIRENWAEELHSNPDLPSHHPEKDKYVRCVASEAAVKRGEKVYLIGIWLGRSRYSEKAPWGELEGNSIWVRWMMEENLKSD